MTKGWQKNNWVKFSGSPVASTNQIFIEDVLYVVIKKYQIKVRYNRHKNNKKQWRKSMSM